MISITWNHNILIESPHDESKWTIWLVEIMPLMRIRCQEEIATTCKNRRSRNDISFDNKNAGINDPGYNPPQSPHFLKK
jgi:hypothetical protein